MNFKTVPIYINNGIAAILGSSQQTNIHKHHVLQMAIILSGDYDIDIDNKHIKYSVFINSNIPHGHTCIKGKQLSIFVEPESYIGEMLQKKYQNKYQELDYDRNKLSEIINHLFVESSSPELINNHLFSILNLEHHNIELDNRIQELLIRIESSESYNLTVSKILSETNLSESRIRHLFKEHTGISIKKYLLWEKMKNAINHLLGGTSITEAAHFAGFSDSAHMTRTFKEMFGLNPAKLVKDSHSIQELSDWNY